MRVELIRSKIEEILESLKLVEEHLPEDFETFQSLGLIKDGIYKRVEFAIQNVIDICAIINSDLKLGIPEKEEDVFEGLVRGGIISKGGLAQKLRLMKGFRNVLVHRYGRINDELAFEALREHLDDIYEFIETIEKFLEGQK
ncbi:HepT-like ribonuclease domain-containing protein [Thermococcus sp. JCM 11816]|uniref:type VII toxin-antitoxin system HepT family RNase toxin n=1 Tax=Thermococcus sp. (strain JCM 11816 / KS-1) TaxID=1295125 RepID=UPI0006D19CCD